MSDPTMITQRPTDAVSLRNIQKVYGTGKRAVTALSRVDIGFRKGTFTAVMGPSGSGKSTLLHLAAGLDRPNNGTVVLDGVDLTALREKQLTVLRRDRIGFMFQSFNLLPALTVAQNVTLSLRLAGRRIDKHRLGAVLDSVGLTDLAGRWPSELSGGQQQRVAIARTLITDPVVIFADEPTGALDTRTAAEVLTLLARTVREVGRTVVMVTHDPMAASYSDRVVFLADGSVVGGLDDPTVDEIAQQMVQLDGRGGRNSQRTSGSLAAAGVAR